MTYPRPRLSLLALLWAVGLFVPLTFAFGMVSKQGCENQVVADGDFCDHVDYGFVSLERYTAAAAIVIASAAVAVLAVAAFSALSWLVGWVVHRVTAATGPSA